MYQHTTHRDVHVSLQGTPSKLKLQLERLTGIPAAVQRLSCRGKVLQDHVSLCEHNATLPQFLNG